MHWSKPSQQFTTYGASLAIVAVAAFSLAPSFMTSSAAEAVSGGADVAEECVNPRKELFITDTSVVDDPCRASWILPSTTPCAPGSRGAWTFGTLIAHIAGFTSIDQNPVALSRYVLDWLDQFASVTTVENGIEVPPRPSFHHAILDEWIAVSNEANNGLPQGTLDMRLAPFRLLAIVNRMDLRNIVDCGQEHCAGEGRFVFGILDIPTKEEAEDLGINRFAPHEWFKDFGGLRGTVILEYHLPVEDCWDVLLWADRWHHLGTLPFGENFNAHLQELITDNFAGFAAGSIIGGPNGSALAQLRTNEVIDFLDNVPHLPGWELREFQLPSIWPSTRTPLVQTTVADTVSFAPGSGLGPAFNYPNHNNSALLNKWIADNQLDLVRFQHQIPDMFQGQVFRAGSSFNPGNFNDLIDPNAPGNVPVSNFAWEVSQTFHFSDTRFNFAFNNCNGCHAAEAGLFDEFDFGHNFVHVDVRDHGEPSILSRFLTGDPPIGHGVDDPSDWGIFPVLDGTKTRFFNDLERRANDLCHLLNSTCAFVDDESEGGLEQLDAPQILDIYASPFKSTRVH